MSYTRGNGRRHWHSIDSLVGGPLAPQSNAVSAITWGVADRAIYVPIVVADRVVVKKLWYANEATATGNYDIGLFTATGEALLRKGSAAKSTTATEIVWDCTDTTIGPGLYYIGLVMSVQTDTITSTNPTAPFLTALGLWTEASALPLPATATFGITQTLAVFPLVGMFCDTRAS